MPAPAPEPLRLAVLGQIRAAGPVAGALVGAGPGAVVPGAVVPGGVVPGTGPAAAAPPAADLLPVTGLGANLLLALVLEPRGLSSARAVDETWPDGAPASGRAALQTLVSRLRAAHDPRLVVSTASGYALGADATQVDLLRAAEATARARAALAGGDPAGAATLAADALALWAGEPGTGATAPNLLDLLRRRAEGLRRDLLRLLATALLDLAVPTPTGATSPDPASSAPTPPEPTSPGPTPPGPTPPDPAPNRPSRPALRARDDAVAATEALLALAPLDDGAHLLRMRALHAAGRTTEAVAAFAAYREQLRDTLGTDPSAEVAAFHVELLAGTAPAPCAARTSTLPPAGAPSVPSAGSVPAAPAAPAGPAARSDPAPSPPARVHGLRVAPNALIGRSADVAAVEALLGTAPVVTVLGTGGLGKTRLVQEVARRAVDRYPAVYVAELASVRDDPDVLPALAAALALPEPAARRGVADVRLRSLPERVLDRLGEQPTLLVLDNCEHVLDGVGAWVAEVVAALPSVQVLTTSRAPLGVQGERVHPLDPLPARAPDGSAGAAVRLFTERATAVRPGVQLPQDVVERLCRRLDGLPLAIELAAARTRSLTVVEVERRLSDRFALLVSGATGAPERHRTLHAVIEWSWDLLTERQRVLCRRVAAFPDGFGLSAALAVLAGDADEAAVLDDLDALVAQSLLRAEEDELTGGMRYRMLETVREFGQRETAAAGEAERVRVAVRDWAREVAGQLVRDAGSPERILLDLVGEVEHDTFVAVLRRELAAGADRPDAVLTLFAVVALRWMMMGAHAELEDIQASLVEASERWSPDGDVEPAVVALVVLASIELLFGDVRTGARARLTLRRAAASADLRPVPRMLVATVEGFADPASLARILAGGRVSTDLASRRLALLASWSVAENEGDLAASIGYARDAYHLAVDTDDPWTAVMAAVSLAGAYSQSLRPREAMDWLDTARAALAAPRLTHRDLLLQAFAESLEQVYGVTLLTLGEWDEAERVFAKVARATTDVRDAEVMAALGMAEVERGRGEVERGLARHRKLLARATGRETGGPWLLVAAGTCLAAHALEGRADEPLLAQSVARIPEDLLVGRPGFTDRPVLGTLVAGVGSWRVATAPQDPAGLELLVLAERIGARQDFPCGVLAPHLALATARYGQEAVARARAGVADLPHGADVVRALALLRDVRAGAA